MNDTNIFIDLIDLFYAETARSVVPFTIFFIVIA
jgi:hypothetical protein